MKSASGEKVTDSYNHAVQRLTAFRNVHLQIVTRYIINPARKAHVTENAGINLAVASAKKGEKELQGTGGTELMAFLKQSRDETKNTMA